MNKIAIILILLISMTAGLKGNASNHSEYWHQRVSLFEELPIHSGDIVFVGNSITDGGEFAELFDNPNIKNRGISGDTVEGVLERINQVTKYSPSKIFLLIGINDVSHGESASTILSEFKELIAKIHEESPETKLYIQSVMPVNMLSFNRYKNLNGKEDVILAINKGLPYLTSSGDTYIDLWAYLADEDGNLLTEYTNDGLHLNGKGYKKWVEAIHPYVDDKVTTIDKHQAIVHTTEEIE